MQSTLNIILWALDLILIAQIINFIYIRRRFVNKIKNIDDTIDELNIINKENLLVLESYNERNNLLSNENNKLRQKNEMLVERLEALGLKDLD